MSVRSISGREGPRYFGRSNEFLPMHANAAVCLSVSVCILMSLLCCMFLSYCLISSALYLHVKRHRQSELFVLLILSPGFFRYCAGGYRTFRPGSVSARKDMDVSAKSMDDSAKNDERFGQKRWTFRPNIYLIVVQRQMTHTIENSHLHNNVAYRLL